MSSNKNVIVKRVPIGLEWNRGEVWFGYRFSEHHCECCMGIGSVNWELKNPTERQRGVKSRRDCPICQGKGKVQPVIDVPKGNGYQLWVTDNYKTGVDEKHYYPLSPEFETAFDLAEWMAKNFTINDDPLASEQAWYDAIQDNTVDLVYGLYMATNEHFNDFDRLLKQ